MKLNIQYITYLLGIFLAGIFYTPIKLAIGGELLFLISAISYLVSLRFLGVWAAKFYARKKSNET